MDGWPERRFDADGDDSPTNRETLTHYRTRDDRQVVVMFAGFKISLDFVYMFAGLSGRLSVACLIGTCRYADDGTGLNGN